MKPVLVACAAGAALALGACGQPTPEEQVRETMDRFAAALAEKDYQEMCEQLFARQLLTSLESVGVPCGVALLRGFEDVREPTLQVQRVQVRSEGVAFVDARTDAANQDPYPAIFQLVREGETWKVASLAQAQPPRPARPPASTGPGRLPPPASDPSPPRRERPGADPPPTPRTTPPTSPSRTAPRGPGQG